MFPIQNLIVLLKVHILFAQSSHTISHSTAFYDWYNYYGRGGGPIHPKYFKCAGTDERLSQCESHNTTITLTHDDDIGIYCRPGMIPFFKTLNNSINITVL